MQKYAIYLYLHFCLSQIYEKRMGKESKLVKNSKAVNQAYTQVQITNCLKRHVFP